MGTSLVSISDYLILFAVSLFLVGITTPIMRRLALNLDITDKPNAAHKTHKLSVPYLGGIAIMIGTISVTVLALVFAGRNEDLSFALSLLIPAALLGLVGLVDDLKNLSPLFRFLAQSVAGIFTAVFVLTTTSFGNPTGSTVFDVVISIIWIVGITNSINFFDNLDGGAAGAVAFTGLGTFIIASSNGQYFVAATAIVLFGAMVGFLAWNRSPARIYMGDAGALFLGFMVAVLTLRLDPDVDNKFLSFAVPLFLLAIPIMDTSVAVTSRIVRKVSPFQGGRDHLSHRILHYGVTKRQTAYMLWSLSFLFALAACLIALGVFDNSMFLGLFSIIWILLFMFFLKSKSS